MQAVSENNLGVALGEEGRLDEAAGSITDKRVREKIRDMSERRERLGLPPLKFGVAAYAIVRDSEFDARRELERITNVKQSAAGYENYQQWLAGTRLEQQVSLEDYSVSNRGLRSGLVGTPDRVAERVREFEDAGVDLLLLQCSPQLEEMERFAETVIKEGRIYETYSYT